MFKWPFENVSQKVQLEYHDGVMAQKPFMVVGIQFHNGVLSGPSP